MFLSANAEGSPGTADLAASGYVENGVVQFDLLNATLQHDIACTWHEAYEHIMRSGDTYAAVTCSPRTRVRSRTPSTPRAARRSSTRTPR